MFNCTVCPATFKTKKGLANHKHRWICEYCGAILRTENGYNMNVLSLFDGMNLCVK